ncbi:putative toxin-antitoxin system toxin component, PIN family [Candidatus Pacearchaeota archaeon CG_4_10_14_0_2_um_filter_05_32_18]|nr:MAG: putative toxin-antitoxin system toxin component, PIN family [Candidatus Pacearchaeota archaeon CG_4_10_14_0_2_um_filter_05_32_18]
MRIVLDTNVFISGIFWDGNFCSKIIDKWKNEEFELVSSLEIIEELLNTLKHFKIQLDEETIESWRNVIIERAIIAESSERLDVIKEDPNDNKFLETAIAGKADFIITQDNHLLKVKRLNNVMILNPEEFLKLSKFN